MATTFEDLPLEVIMAILLMLPAEGLLSFMCVSKAWYAVISCRDFIHKHLKRSASGNGHILCGPKMVYNPEKTFDLISRTDFGVSLMEGIPPPCEINSDCSLLIGSSGGLVCLTDMNRYGCTIHLWNPFIRKRRSIYSSSISVNELYGNFNFLVLGFGYVPEINEHKVVRIAYVENDHLAYGNDNDPVDYFCGYYDGSDNNEGDYDGSHDNGDDNGGSYYNGVNDIGLLRFNWGDYDFGDDNVEASVETDAGIQKGASTIEVKHKISTQVEVYSLSTDTWKKIEVPSFPWFMCDTFSRSFVNNCLHWLVFHQQMDEDESLILSFDLVSEGFSQIKLPQYEFDVSRRLELTVYDGSLSFLVVSTVHANEFFSFWVMKEYGNPNSWTNIFNVELNGMAHWPSCITMNDEVLFIEGETHELRLYHLQNKEIRAFNRYPEPDELDFLPIVSSLILLQANIRLLENNNDQAPEE